MVFASLLFLFLFLPATLAIYHATPKRARNLVLLVASLLFYVWGEQEWAIVMGLSIVLNWLGALGIDALTNRRAQKWLLAGVVLVNLAGLGWFKYSSFALENWYSLVTAAGTATLPAGTPHLPLGISFFTFHAISYVVDVYRGQSRALRNPLDAALYIALFPQLVAGPIIRYHWIEEQLRSRQVTLEGFAYGVQRFVVGLAKKVLIANVVGQTADAIFELPTGTLSLGVAWLGVITYTLQIYFDFSGYSDMAIGLASMFGFRFPENFNYPYVSRSITDFWRRWHISLSSWFRDYLYIPLGGNRVSKARTYFNLITVFLLCGLWHGASWTFVLWGMLHGAFLVLERSRLGSWLNAAPRPVAHVYTLLVVCVGWVLFRAPDIGHASEFLRAMVDVTQPVNAAHPLRAFLTPAVCWMLPIAVLGSTPILQALERAFAGRSARGLTEPPGRTFVVPVLLVLFVLSAANLAASTHNPFIYFRF